MPELPEVETIARGLRQTLIGKRILAVELGKTDFMDDPAELELNLPGRRIQKVDRFGKFLLLGLGPRIAEPAAGGPKESASSALLVHLGMTGHLAPVPAGRPRGKHAHLLLSLDDGRELRYTDPRRFGRIAFLGPARLAAELSRFGADPLEVGPEEFSLLIRKRRARIKAMLLDQSVLRGVGNIYADESLWKARIHPAALGEKLSKAQAEKLRVELRKILQKAIVLRGSSISDFLDADGEPGEYQRRHRVYGREGENCFRCRTRIRRGTVAGRSSWFCPGCQRSPGGFRALPLPKRVRRR